MPRNKDLKRLVRARMRKTGEAYTAARTHIVSNKPARPAAPAAAPAVDYAALAGMSDSAVKNKTGCTWEKWVFVLDYSGAAKMSHPEIARLVQQKWKVSGWWAQMVTVGYERIKGLRARGQRRDGSYEASKSRTFNVPVTRLFDAFADARVRRRWLNETGVKLRAATAPRSLRLGWSDGSVVGLWFTAKGPGKSAVAVQHTKLPDKASVERLKAYWSERLTALQEELQ